jgi:hypothetical protein
MKATACEKKLRPPQRCSSATRCPASSYAGAVVTARPKHGLCRNFDVCVTVALASKKSDCPEAASPDKGSQEPTPKSNATAWELCGEVADTAMKATIGFDHNVATKGKGRPVFHQLARRSPPPANPLYDFSSCDWLDTIQRFQVFYSESHPLADVPLTRPATASPDSGFRSHVPCGSRARAPLPNIKPLVVPLTPLAQIGVPCRTDSDSSLHMFAYRVYRPQRRQLGFAAGFKLSSSRGHRVASMSHSLQLSSSMSEVAPNNAGDG